MNHTPSPSYPIPATDPRAQPDPSVPVPSPARLACPLPRTDHSRVQLAHGGGGTRTQELLEQVPEKIYKILWVIDPAVLRRLDQSILVHLIRVTGRLR